MNHTCKVKLSVCMRTFYFKSLLLILVLMLAGCMTKEKYNWKPGNQPNTRWVSQDKTIEFYVQEDGKGIGTIFLNDKEIDVYISYEPQRSIGMNLYPLSVLSDGVIDGELQYERWLCSFESEKDFVATVDETTYFEKGEKIRFYRVE